MMNRPNVPLSALRVFEAAARLRSFDEASAELHVSPSAVSQQIARLEGKLGAPLFTRQYRRVVLTDTGQALATELTKAFRLVDRALATAARVARKDSIKIAMYQTWASHWLVPQLAGFARDCPQVNIEFVPVPEKIDLDRSTTDFVVCWQPAGQVGAQSVRLFDEVLVAVCAPAVAQQLCMAATPKKIHTICSVNRTSDLDVWLASNPHFVRDDGGSLKFSNTSSAIGAAVAGTGVLVGQVHLFLPEIESGILTLLMNSAVRTARTLCLLEAGRAVGTAVSQPSVVTFKKWMLDEATRADQRARSAFERAGVTVSDV